MRDVAGAQPLLLLMILILLMIFPAATLLHKIRSTIMSRSRK
jgi:hypothetical protein